MAKKLHSFKLLYQSPVLSAVAFKFLISLPKWLEARMFCSISTKFLIVSRFDFKIYPFEEIVDYTEQEMKTSLTGDHLYTQKRRFYYLFGLKRKPQKLRLMHRFVKPYNK